MVRPFLLFLLTLLASCGGGDGVTPVSVSGSTYCGVVTGAGRISGVVSLVHDGDTLTVNGQSIRLDSIDAPELDQAYGVNARQFLAGLTLGQQVTITYAKTDFYGRVVGTALMASPNSPTRGHPKFPQAARSDYAPSAWMAKRAAASLSL
jgi:hypothetical protein